MRVFRLENGELVLDKEEIRLIPEYRKLLSRDKGSEGDFNGTKKFRAFKEFSYIYHFADLFSYLNQGGYNEKERHKQSIKEAGLEEDWKPDSEVKAAITKYTDIQKINLPTLNTISTILRSLKLSDTIAHGVIDNIETQMQIMLVNKEKSETPNILADMAAVTALTQQLDVVVDLANKLPKTIETLEKLKERLIKESSGVSTKRGGEEIGSRANPKG
jgi:hypothetical protein